AGLRQSREELVLETVALRRSLLDRRAPLLDVLARARTARDEVVQAPARLTDRVAPLRELGMTGERARDLAPGDRDRAQSLERREDLRAEDALVAQVEADVEDLEQVPELEARRRARGPRRLGVQAARVPAQPVEVSGEERQGAAAVAEPRLDHRQV